MTFRGPIAIAQARLDWYWKIVCRKWNAVAGKNAREDATLGRPCNSKAAMRVNSHTAILVGFAEPVLWPSECVGEPHGASKGSPIYAHVRSSAKVRESTGSSTGGKDYKDFNGVVGGLDAGRAAIL